MIQKIKKLRIRNAGFVHSCVMFYSNAKIPFGKWKTKKCGVHPNQQISAISFQTPIYRMKRKSGKMVHVICIRTEKETKTYLRFKINKIRKNRNKTPAAYWIR